MGAVAAYVTRPIAVGAIAGVLMSLTDYGFGDWQYWTLLCVIVAIGNELLKNRTV